MTYLQNCRVVYSDCNGSDLGVSSDCSARKLIIYFNISVLMVANCYLYIFDWWVIHLGYIFDWWVIPLGFLRTVNNINPCVKPSCFLVSNCFVYLHVFVVSVHYYILPRSRFSYFRYLSALHSFISCLLFCWSALSIFIKTCGVYAWFLIHVWASEMLWCKETSLRTRHVMFLWIAPIEQCSLWLETLPKLR